MKNSPDTDPSAFTPELELDPQGPRHLTESQARAHRELAALAELAGHHHPYGGVKPRTKPLLVGSTGVGKSAVVVRLADTLARPGHRYPLLAINAGGWIIFGARAQPATLTTILTFIRANEYGILFLDELDKATSNKAWTDPWYCTVTAELLALLDGSNGDTRLFTCGWTQSDIDRLSQFLLVGAGAWQRHAKAKQDEASHLQAIHDESGIPEELLYRFNSRPIYVQAPTRKDYQATFTRIYSALGLSLPSEPDLDALISAAVSSRSGMRFCEQHLSDLLCAHPKLRQRAPSTPAPKATSNSSEAGAETTPAGTGKTLAVPQALFDNRREQVYTLMASLEPDIVHVGALFVLCRCQFAKLRVVDHRGEPVKQARLEEDFILFLDGLRHCYSLNDKERHKRQEHLWLVGSHLLQAVTGAIESQGEFLQQHGLLALFARTKAGISRFLTAWEYICSVRPTNKPEEL